MKKTAHFQRVFFVTSRNTFHILILLTVLLVFCLIPAHCFGQPTLGSLTEGVFPPPGLTPPPTAPELSWDFLQTETPITPAETPPTPAFESLFAPIQAQPEPVVATVNPQTANQFTTVQPSSFQSTQLQSPQRETVVNAQNSDTQHPFARYWGVPNEPQSKIVGKPMTVAELFAGTRSTLARRQLLQAYWELSGLLAIYHFRLENERLATESQQENMFTLLHEQRRTAEVEFIRQQWVLAGLLNQYKGRPLRESELPIPSDFPLYPRYETFADQIAWSERTQYLGRMIPIQEQLIETKHNTWNIASAMTQSASQPLFVVSTQRAMAFLDLTKAIVEYNKMIAEYALETIPPNVSTQQLVAAVVRLPGVDGRQQAADGRWQMAGDRQQTADGRRQMADGRQQAAEGIQLTSYETPAMWIAQPLTQVGYEYQPPLSSSGDTVPSPPAVRGLPTMSVQNGPESQVPSFMLEIM